jgi:nicotinate-nucleotide adenylyltransferase
MRMRLGLLGGTFDPIHFGHLLLAETCREQRELDQVWFVPAGVAPHKQGAHHALAQQRVEMIKLAIGGHPAMSVSTVEVDRGGVSYTVETLESLQQHQPNAELFCLMGADSLRDLPTWREPARICQLATLVVVARPDSPAPDFDLLRPVTSDERITLFRDHQVEMPPIGLSSSEIRPRVAAQKSIRLRTPRAVEKYIQNAGLYRNAT